MQAAQARPPEKRAELLAPADPEVRNSGKIPREPLCVSPDEAFVAWSQLDRDTEELKLVEGFR